MSSSSFMSHGVNTAQSKFTNLQSRSTSSLIDLDRLHEHMKELGSKYSKLGLSEQVSIAVINVDANDVPIVIDSYPSIRLYRAGTNEIVSFQGNFTQMLTVEQLDKFIFTSGSHGVSAFGRERVKHHDEL